MKLSLPSSSPPASFSLFSSPSSFFNFSFTCSLSLLLPLFSLSFSSLARSLSFSSLSFSSLACSLSSLRLLHLLLLLLPNPLPSSVYNIL